MRSKFALLGLLLLPFIPKAQTAELSASESIRPKYFFNISSGGLFGKRLEGSLFTASTIHGVSLRSMRLGAGLGYDAYQNNRTMPLFGSFAVDFGHVGTNRLYLQVNAGRALSWYLHDDPNTSVDNLGGGMLSSGIGYRIVTDKLSVHIEAAYRFQRIRYAHVYQWSLDSRHVYEMDLHRIGLQLGFGWGD